jgi:vacuolar-type H+-ATPase subunit I/STV1
MKILSFFTGLLLISAIVCSGYYTVHHNSFVIWFGVITALLTPFAMEAILYPFKSGDKKMLQNLAKVSEINKLIKKAEDKETKVRQLETQLRQLDQLIAYESKRRTLEAEKAIYLFQAQNALKGLDKVQGEIAALTSEKQQLPEELVALQKQLERGGPNDIELLIGTKTFVLRQKDFDGISIYGTFVFELFRLIQKAFRSIEKKP